VGRSGRPRGQRQTIHAGTVCSARQVLMTIQIQYEGDDP
jgi:hypothetical protein